MPEPMVKTDSISFKELMMELENGVMKIPEFQRDFDWEVERTLRLLDSIGKRYPVGAFLFWDTDETLGTLRNIGDLELPEVPDGKDVTYVLDGQQRITSLYAAAHAAEIRGRSYDVYADLDADPSGDDIFCSGCADAGRFVSLSSIIGKDPHLTYSHLPAARQVRFHDLREAFNEYRFPAIRVRNQPINAVCEMFERVNTGGMKLERFDIMVAKTWTPQFNLRSKWEELTAELRIAGYGDIDPNIALHVLGVHLRRSIKDKEILGIDRQEIIGAWPRVVRCLHLAVDYLRQVGYAPGLRLLSYPFVIVVLAHFYDLSSLQEPDKAQSERLQQYLWRVGFTQRYGSNPSSTVPEDLKLMEAIFKGRQMDVPVDYPVTVDVILRTPLRTGSAFVRTILALLTHQRPVCLKNGNAVVVDNSGLARSNSRHYHHIFPKAALARLDFGYDESNCIANIMLVPQHDNLKIGAKLPSSYMTRLSRKADQYWRKWMQSHLISARAEQAMLGDDYWRFLRHRASTIAAKANAAMGLSKDEVAGLIQTEDVAAE